MTGAYRIMNGEPIRTHTLGPWRVFHFKSIKNCTGVTSDGDGADIAHCAGFNSARSRDEELANAKLIAMAPRMYDLLREFLHDGRLQTFGDREQFRGKAGAILSEVDGE